MFHINPRVPVLAALVLISAAAAQSYLLVVNGQPTPTKAITVNGQTYVPLSALRLLGVQSSLKGSTLTLGAQPAPTPGGANQKASLEGCIGETLFNGVWRLTVRKVEPIGADVGLGPGWGVMAELRNGTTTKTSLLDTGLTSIDLVGPDGNTFVFEERTAEEPFLYKTVTQAGGVTYQLRFHVQDARAEAASVPRPSKLTVQIDPKRLTAGYLIAGKVAYTTPTPSFRVKLDCQK
jgi:hypothetical protein